MKSTLVLSEEIVVYLIDFERAPEGPGAFLSSVRIITSSISPPQYYKDVLSARDSQVVDSQYVDS